MGQIAVLNVGTGDTKLTFDPKSPAETIRAKRIVQDMLRRGYAMLIEVKKGKRVEYRRVKAFDPKTCEYIIADFDPVEAAAADAKERETDVEGGKEGGAAQSAPAEAPDKVGGAAAPARKRKTRDVRVPAQGATGVAIARSAGG